MASEVAEESAQDAAAQGVVKSAGRAFEVLELFAQMRRHLSASEIGQALGYPKSSTSALLKSLLSQGYLVLNPRTLRYFPSLSVTKLGDWIPAAVLSSGDVLEILSEVHAATQETVTLSVRKDFSVTFLRVLPGTYPISLQMTEGFVGPLFSSAVGNAILSQMTDEEIAATVERANARPKRTAERVDLGKLMRGVQETRRKGYSVYYDAFFPDTGAIAVPLPSAMEGFPMAVGAGGLRDRIRRNEAVIYRAIRNSIMRHIGKTPRRRGKTQEIG